MPKVRETLTNLDEQVCAELEARQERRQRQARHEAGALAREFQARLSSGLVAREKLDAYLDALDDGTMRLEALQPPFAREIERLREAQLTLAQDFHLVGCPPTSVVDGWDWDGTWKDADPAFQGGATASVILDKWQGRASVRLQTYGGYSAASSLAQAWGGVIMRFKIPGQYIPQGIIKVTPYLNVQGLARVAAYNSFYNTSAHARIEVQTRLGEGTQYPYPWVKTLTNWTKPATLWQSTSPPITTQHGYHDLDLVGAVSQAAVTSHVAGNFPIYVEVLVEMRVQTVGPLTVAALSLDGSGSFLQISQPCGEMVATYLYMKTPGKSWMDRYGAVPRDGEFERAAS